jgi:hypothetical protein
MGEQVVVRDPLLAATTRHVRPLGSRADGIRRHRCMARSCRYRRFVGEVTSESGIYRRASDWHGHRR